MSNFISIPLLAFLFTTSITFAAGPAECRLFVWDEGPQPGVIDEKDFIVDMGVPCVIRPEGVSGAVQIPTFKVAKELIGQPLRPAQLPLADFFKTLNAPSNPYEERFTKLADFVRITESEPGTTGKTVILLPEAHIPINNNPDGHKRFVELSYARTLFTIILAEKLKAKNERLVNLFEGLAKLPAISPNYVADDRDKADSAAELLATESPRAFALMSHLYGPPFMNSRHVEASEKLIATMMLVAHSYTSRMTLSDIIKPFRDIGLSTDHLSDSEIGVVYRRLQRMNRRQTIQYLGTLCEDRSEDMAKSAIESMREPNVNFALLGFGASHAYGIINALKRAGVGYVLLEPTGARQ